MVNFEKEVLAYLNLPSIPKKEHDGKSAFENGVAVVALRTGHTAYTVASFNPELGDTKPRIKKVFSSEPFIDILRVYLVPNYMETDMTGADLDAESMKKAQEIINEAKEIEDEGTELETPTMPENEWVFDEIHNIEEARAWLSAYNKRNRINGRIPSSEENIKLRLLSIKSELCTKNI